MQHSIEIRRPITKDLEQIVSLNRVSLPENYPIGYFVQLIKNWHEVSAVAVLDETLIGYAIVRIENNMILGIIKSTKKHGHIISVAVSPEKRGKGTATKMMQFVMKNIMDSEKYQVSEFFLEVRETNISAIKLYEKLGFTIGKKVESYYRDGEVALVMKLKVM